MTFLICNIFVKYRHINTININVSFNCMSFNTCINLSISNCEHEICIKAKIKNLIKVARGTCKQVT